MTPQKRPWQIPRIFGITLLTSISDVRQFTRHNLRGLISIHKDLRSCDDVARLPMGIECGNAGTCNKRRPSDDLHDRPLKRRSTSPEHHAPRAIYKQRQYNNSVKRTHGLINAIGTTSLVGVRKTSPISHLFARRAPNHPKMPATILKKSPTRDQASDIFQLANLAMSTPIKDEETEDEMYARARLKEEDRKAAQRQTEQKRSMEAQQNEEERFRRAVKKKRLAFQRLKDQKAEAAQRFQQEKVDYEKYLEALRSLDGITISDPTLTGKVRRDKYGSFPEVPQKQKYLVKLSDAWEKKIQAALAITSDFHVIGKSVEGTELSRKDLARVLPGEPWLNDEIVNAWYANLCARLNAKDGYVKGPTKTPRWVAYSTAWYKSATERGVSSIQGWSKRKGIKGEKLLQTERIFFPTNSGAHWTLLTISGKHKTIEYLDSMNEAGWKCRKYIKLALDWLKMELGAKFHEEEWTILQTKSAQQNNMNDCGVFACLNGWAMVKGSKDPSMEFTVGEIPLARKMLVATLLNGGFTGDFEL